MILVTGATGNVGGHLISDLCRAGAQTRALVRSPERADTLRGYDCDVAIGDYTDAGSLASALRGVDRVFLVGRPGPDHVAAEGGVVQAVIDHAPEAQVVKLATLGIEQQPSRSRIQTAHQQIIDRLAGGSVQHTVLAANSFMQNFIGQAAAIQGGAIYSTIGDARLSHIDARDVAAVAAHVLTSDGHVGATYTLTGPEALTFGEVAERFSKFLGREVRYVNLTETDWRGAMLGAGLSPWLVDALAELNRMYTDGAGAAVTDEVTKATGRPARAIEDFLADHRAAFAV